MKLSQDAFLNEVSKMYSTHRETGKGSVTLRFRRCELFGVQTKKGGFVMRAKGNFIVWIFLVLVYFVSLLSLSLLRLCVLKLAVC